MLYNIAYYSYLKVVMLLLYSELLEETEKLMKEKIEVQRQAEKEYDDLQKQVKVLEIDLEEQVNRFIELEQEKNAELMDLRQQNQALEKQLEKTRKFLDVSMVKGRFHEGGLVILVLRFGSGGNANFLQILSKHRQMIANIGSAVGSSPRI